MSQTWPSGSRAASGRKGWWELVGTTEGTASRSCLSVRRLLPFALPRDKSSLLLSLLSSRVTDSSAHMFIESQCDHEIEWKGREAADKCRHLSFPGACTSCGVEDGAFRRPGSRALAEAGRGGGASGRSSYTQRAYRAAGEADRVQILR